MRRRRKPLEVSTFPFLAVLLCAMGSLILVLLVMDRKAKAGARAKALAKAAGQYACAAAEAERAAAARRAELEQRMRDARAEWEKKRAALHTKLLSEQQALQLEMQQLREKMTRAAARLRAEQEQAGELRKQVATDRERLEGETAALAATRQALADGEKRTEQEKAALARMKNDLAVLERALKDLKEAREREKQTYSVVPYHGKRGESRRPLYVECAGDRVIFHPDKKSLLVPVQRAEILEEVERRVARQQQQSAPGKPPAEPVPYLLMLVRPDGIQAYYAFQAVLAGRSVNFGYELIDADWVLDFPADEQPGEQPWQRLAKLPDVSPPEAPKPGEPTVRGVQMGRGPALPPLPADGPKHPAAEGTSGPSGSGSGGPGARSDNPLSSSRGGGPGAADGGPDTAGRPGAGTPARVRNDNAEGTPGSPPAVAQGPPPGPGDGQRDPDTPTGNESIKAAPPRGVPPIAPGSDQRMGATGQRTEGAPGSTPAGPSEPRRDPPEREPHGGLRPLPTPGGEPKRPPGLHPARLSGDRDYLIFIECRPDGVVLYPSQKQFPLTALKPGPDNALVQAVRQMIDRKQSGVRPGELPYRPQVRFLVRPESLQTYHRTYPLFTPLPIAKTRQNLIPEDDVLSIIAGN